MEMQERASSMSRPVITYDDNALSSAEEGRVHDIIQAGNHFRREEEAEYRL